MIYANSREFKKRHLYCNNKSCIDNKRCMNAPCYSRAKIRFLRRDKFERIVDQISGARGTVQGVLAILSMADHLGYFDDPIVINLELRPSRHEVEIHRP